MILSQNTTLLRYNKVPKDVNYYIRIFIFYCLFLYLILEYSIVILPDNLARWIEVTIMILAMICFYLLPVIVFSIGLKGLVGVVYLVNENVNYLDRYKKMESKDMKRIIGLLITCILLIPIAPSFLFWLIYGTTISITKLPDTLGYIFQLKYVYYSIAISYSLPSDEIIKVVQSEKNEHKWKPIIPAIQAVLQKLVDIFLLGYIASMLTKVIHNLQNFKHSSFKD